MFRKIIQLILLCFLLCAPLLPARGQVVLAQAAPTADFGDAPANTFVLDQDKTPGLGVEVARRPAGRFDEQPLVFRLNRRRLKRPVGRSTRTNSI